MHKIKKAIIPVAGLATRIYPMNKITKKAFLPIIDVDGRVKPLILNLVEELVDAGIEEIYLIIQKDDEPLYNQLFESVDTKIYNKLKENDRIYENKLEEIGGKIKYIVQKNLLGFGHAVYQAKEYINNEPCILILGDTVYKSNESKSCVNQLLDFYDEYGDVIIALQELKEEELKYYGTVYGKWDNIQKTKISLETIVEKPSIEFAKKYLLIDGKFYGNFGEFILTSEVFEELEQIMNKPLKDDEEYQLMDAFENVIKRRTCKGLVINGLSYDAGNVEAYKKVMREY